MGESARRDLPCASTGGAAAGSAAGCARCATTLRPWITRPLMRLNLALFPTLYLLYMRFVWATSRIVDHGLARCSRSAPSTMAPSGCSGTRR